MIERLIYIYKFISYLYSNSLQMLTRLSFIGALVNAALSFYNNEVTVYRHLIKTQEFLPM